ncbi:conjugative transposon protein TraJ [Hymenobacter seoulensis]
MDPTAIDLNMAVYEQKLEAIYTEMLTFTAQFINLGRAIGGIGALLFISSKVWGNIARAEPIDLFPLLRPFAIGLAILLFVPLCSGLRGITMAVAQGTDAIRLGQLGEVNRLTIERDRLAAESKAKSDMQINQKYEEDLANLGALDLDRKASLAMNQVQYSVGQNFREWTKSILELGALAAKLAISLISTFLLVLLSVAGPLAFGIAIIPGFGGGIRKWFSYFLTISLWVPVANIYAAVLAHVQVTMLHENIRQLQAGGSVESADIAYLCMLVLAIAGYLFVPKAADMLIDGSDIGRAATRFISSTTVSTAGFTGALSGAGVRTGGDVLGSAVGVGHGLAGMGGPSNMTRGEYLGYRAGTAVRERLNRRRG